MEQPRPTERMRRSGAEIEAAAHTATVRLLIEGGPAAVTMEAVAALIGTSKPVLYRRWTDSGALMRDALLSRANALMPQPDTGSLRGDIRLTLTNWAASFGTPQAALYPVVVGIMAHDHEFAEGFRSTVVRWRRQTMRQIFTRAAERGEVSPDAPFDIVSELGQAVLWHRLLITGDEIDEAFIDRILDEVVLPLATRFAPPDADHTSLPKDIL